MDAAPLSRFRLMRLALVRIGGSLVVLSGLIFLSAGTLAYWEGWMYMATLFVPMASALVYFLRTAPALLERRMRIKETEPAQQRLIQLGLIYFLILFTLPGLERRFAGSHVPPAVSIAADAFVLLGYGLFLRVLRENRFASRVVEVEAEQVVVTTGPYALVRHPMYLGLIVMYTFTPLALGSLWAILPALAIIPILAARIRNEEQVLLKELKGYGDYMQATPFRLIPRVW